MAYATSHRLKLSMKLNWDIKLQIFGAEGAENFEKCRVFKEKLAIFGVLREILAEF